MGDRGSTFIFDGAIVYDDLDRVCLCEFHGNYDAMGIIWIAWASLAAARGRGDNVFCRYFAVSVGEYDFTSLASVIAIT